MPHSAAVEKACQYVTLGIDTEVFAIDVAQVHEILDLRPVTRIPNAPPYLIGMIDVRQRTVPVVDLRIKLGLPPVAPTPATRITVLDSVLNGRNVVLGLMADRVYEVAPLSDLGTEGAPDIGVRWNSRFIRAIGRRGDKFVIVLDIGQLFGCEDTVLADHLAAPAMESSGVSA